MKKFLLALITVILVSAVFVTGASANESNRIADVAYEIGQLEKCISKYAGAKLVDITLFDIYTGERLGADKKSVAFSLTLRDDNKTLTDEDADKITAKVIKGMEFDHNAVLRS